MIEKLWFNLLFFFPFFFLSQTSEDKNDEVHLLNKHYFLEAILRGSDTFFWRNIICRSFFRIDPARKWHFGFSGGFQVNPQKIQKISIFLFFSQWNHLSQCITWMVNKKLGRIKLKRPKSIGLNLRAFET